MGIRTLYASLVQLFSDHGCILLTTAQEYDENKMNKQSKYKYVAMCGHENEVYGTNFMNGSGRNCKECAKVIVNQKTRDRIQINGNKHKTIAEITKIFTDLLDGEGTIKWKPTADQGALNDVLIQIGDGKSVRVLVRYCNSTSDKYRYVVNEYTDDYILVCLTNSDKLWIMQKSDLQGVKYLSISLGSGSTYDTYKYSTNEIINQLQELYENTQIAGESVYKTFNEGFKFGDIFNIFNEKSCQLLTNKDQFEKERMTTKSKLEVQMQCGHQMTITTKLFQRRSHFVCNDCIQTNAKQKGGFNTIERVSESSLVEAESYSIVRELLKDRLNIQKTHEQCICDMIVKPLDDNRNEWMGIQLKCRTLKCRTQSSQYCFTKLHRYDGFLIICVGLPSKQMWLFEGSSLINQKTISIGLVKSKYDEYECAHNKLCIKILEMYDKLPKFPREVLMIPTSESAKKEHTNRCLREAIMGNDFEILYPTKDGTKHDVIINGYKVQDKMARVSTRDDGKKYMSVNLQASPQYIKGDNNFYWVTMPDKHFYILPENILLDDDGICKKSVYLSRRYEEYLYDMNDDNCTEKLLQVFKKK
jgi:hypothetical protein